MVFRNQTAKPSVRIVHCLGIYNHIGTNKFQIGGREFLPGVRGRHTSDSDLDVSAESGGCFSRAHRKDGCERCSKHGQEHCKRPGGCGSTGC